MGPLPVRPAMGAAYGRLLQDRDQLLNELHSHAAAASEPAIRDVLRRGWADIYSLVAEESGATAGEIRRFFAAGMLMNVMVAIEAPQLDEEWARALTAARNWYRAMSSSTAVDRVGTPTTYVWSDGGITVVRLTRHVPRFQVVARLAVVVAVRSAGRVAVIHVPDETDGLPVDRHRHDSRVGSDRFQVV